MSEGHFWRSRFDGLSVGEDTGALVREFFVNKYVDSIGPVQISLIE